MADLAGLVQREGPLLNLALSGIPVRQLCFTYAPSSRAARKAAACPDLWQALLARDFDGCSFPEAPRLFYRWAFALSLEPFQAVASAEALHRTLQATDGSVHLPVCPERAAELSPGCLASIGTAVLLAGLGLADSLEPLRLPEPVAAALEALHPGAAAGTLAQLVSCGPDPASELGLVKTAVTSALLDAHCAEWMDKALLDRVRDQLEAQRGNETLPRHGCGLAAVLAFSQEGPIQPEAWKISHSYAQAAGWLVQASLRALAEPRQVLLSRPVEKMLAVYLEATAGLVRTIKPTEEEFRTLIVGLNGSGKTSSLYLLKLNEIVATIPTIGFNVETLELPNAGGKITCWDVGGAPQLRPLWRHYYANTQALMFFVDATGTDEAMLDSREVQPGLVPFEWLAAASPAG